MNVNRRGLILVGVLAVILVFFAGTLLKVQIVKKDDYQKSTVTTYNVNVDAARGEILDRNGTPLVTNKAINSLVLNYAYFPTDQKERNATIYALIKLFEKNGLEYSGGLPIQLDKDGKLVFTWGEDDEVEWLKSSEMLNLNSYATPDNCMDALIKKYQLEEYTLTEAMKIAGVFVDMRKLNFSTTYPYTICEGIDTELVSVIMENKELYKGVENIVTSTREYSDGTIAPHILGRVTKISAETYNEEKAKTEKELEKATAAGASEDEITAIKRNAYLLNDMYGSGGLEGSMESTLRGTRGVKRVTIDSDGNVDEKYILEPKQGNTLILTIDAELQKVAQEALERRISTLDVETDLQGAGAVVVENVHTGEILACATYPSYDNATWAENYSKWATDTEGAPLWNRACMSTYEVGSTFKPCVAIAGLEEGVISPTFTWTCDGYYRYFSDLTLSCAGKAAHGEVNVTYAIKESCNCFFFETGRLLGIDKIDKWASAFGFGQKTGVEINEKQGILAGKEYRESQGGIWHPGDTVQAAIGQSDHQFTLLQLTNYCATIANGGTRYVPHFVKTIMSYDYSEVIEDKKPEVAAQLNISKANLELVKKGMYLVGTEGFCASTFRGLPVEASAKTGTSQVKKVIDGVTVTGNNGFLITYAPAEDPEIAIGIVVETSNSGTKTATIAADIYEYYFSEKPLQGVQHYNTFLR